jgi:signal transduction histidine kinase
MNQPHPTGSPALPLLLVSQSSPRQFLRRGLQTVAMALVIGAVIGYLRDRYLSSIVYAVLISLLSWASIDFGRLALKRDPRSGWPHDWRGPALMVGGCLFGFVVGTTAGDLIFGWSTWALIKHQPRALVGSVAVSALIGATISMFYYLRGRIAFQSAEVAQAERDASRARLAMLQSQLEPHMLFNTLANLRVLIALDPAQATAMLDRLVAFLRATLSASRSGVQPLAAEFDRLADYLALMAVRMGPRLRVETDLPAALRELSVPTLLLQPLVENSIRHGLEPQIEGGVIALRAEQLGDLLVLSVCDSGVGLSADGAAAVQPPTEVGGDGGFGLVQVRERLATLYGDSARLELLPAPGGGTLARVSLPCAALRVAAAIPKPPGAAPALPAAPASTTDPAAAQVQR